jgi:hypothetical protein
VGWWLVLFGAVAGAVLTAIAQAFWKKGERQGDSNNPPEDPLAMTRPARLALVTYLLGVGSLLLYAILKLYIVEFPDAPLMLEGPAPTTTAASTATNGSDGATAGPELVSVFPQSTPGPTPTIELALYGKNFDPQARVRLNRQPRTPKVSDPTLIRVLPEPSDLVGPGTLVVEVTNPDGRISNAAAIVVSRPRVAFNIFDVSIPITREVQLLLLVLCAGALGSYLHALKSLADFIGNRTLTASWFSFYVTRPFIGMTLAFIFYAVLRGGFLTGTPADVRVVNPFGAVAVAALVGMFADKATQKLAEIFETLFKTDDKRTEKLGDPVIDRLDPNEIKAATNPPGDLKIIGDRLSKITTVRLNGQPRQPKSVADKEVIVTLLATDIATAGEIKVTVVTPDGSNSPAATLKIV